MLKVSIPNSHGFESALRRFKRACEKAGIVSKLRQIEAYEKPTAKRKREKAAAIKRQAKRQAKEREIQDKERRR